MFKTPKPPEIVQTPAATPAIDASNPLQANYSSYGQSRAGMGQRPNKILRPYTGALNSTSARPSLLGG